MNFNLPHLGRLGDFEVIETLGPGGFGVVFKAIDVQRGRFVALKVFRPSLGETARARFLDEAKAAAGIHYENVITIYRVDQIGSLPFIAMQLMPGETLESRLARDHLLPPDEVKNIAMQIAAGLRMAHENEVVHQTSNPPIFGLTPRRGESRFSISDWLESSMKSGS